MSRLLQVQNLSVSVGQQCLVDDVSFHIDAGEVFALVGESGSGKSVTSLAIMRLLSDGLNIVDGDVELAGQSLFALTEAQMNGVRGRRIAMVFQEPQSSLNPVHTIGRQIGEVLMLHRKRSGAALKQDVVALLEEVGIPDAEQRAAWYPHQLSGGQKQRVMIAMALACEPDLLIADEPTTALDVTIQKQILNLLNELRKKRQLGILLITHDMGVVAEMADRIAVMRHGQLLEQAPRSEFFSAPKHEYSRQLIHSLPRQDAFREAISQEQTPLLEMNNVCVWFAQRKGILQRIAGYTKAVDGISLTIGHGETLALVGESGSGKSTAGRGILRLTPTTSGEILFNGLRIDQLDASAFIDLRKRIQVVFQDPFSSMNPRMTVREIIEEGMISLKVGGKDGKWNSSDREQEIRGQGGNFGGAGPRRRD